MTAAEVVMLIMKIADALVQQLPPEEQRRCRVLLGHELMVRRTSPLDHARSNGR